MPYISMYVYIAYMPMPGFIHVEYGLCMHVCLCIPNIDVCMLFVSINEQMFCES